METYSSVRPWDRASRSASGFASSHRQHPGLPNSTSRDAGGRGSRSAAITSVPLRRRCVLLARQEMIEELVYRRLGLVKDGLAVAEVALLEAEGAQRRQAVPRQRAVLIEAVGRKLQCPFAVEEGVADEQHAELLRVVA